ncbi:kelch-like protein 4 [Arctopsyche grandis]|uniref:kelch-like protein 4 n=1 Tax=Arctopsyche grandis TaxID=121162 RepID=UPI00406D7DEB
MGDKSASVETFINPQHATSSMSRAHQFLQQRRLCDINIAVGTQKYAAHKLILASASEYFNGEFKEVIRDRERPITELLIRNEDEESVQVVIDYCYTGVIELSENSAKNVMSVASLFQLDDILHAYCNFLQKNMHTSNSLGFWLLGKLHSCPSLEKYAFDFVERHFTEVFEYKEFLKLEVEELNLFIKSDGINVSNEEFVFKVVKEWLLFDRTNRDRHMVTLLENVKLPLMPLTFLFDEVQSLCGSTADCQKLVTEAIQWHTIPERRGQLASNRTRPRGLKSIAIGLWQRPMVKVYNSESDSWSTYTTLDMGRLHFSLAIVGDKLMAIGGLSNSTTLGNCEYINLKTSEKEVLPPLQTARWGTIAATLNGKVYAMGGWDGSNYSEIVERWDPAKRTWEYVAAMPYKRMLSSAAVLNDTLYVVGGRDEFAALDTAVSYNATTNKWKRCATMKEKRNYVGLAAHGSYLYAVGGCVGKDTDSENLSSVEKYDPQINRWLSVAPISTPRHGVTAGVLNNKLIALGGRRGNTKFSEVEQYDEKMNKWMPFAALGDVPGVFHLMLVPPGALEDD